MRTTFINTLTEAAQHDSRLVVMTGDLGFKIFDELKAALGPRFINAGVAESNMLTVAASMAMNGFKVYCYTMVPFLTMRAFEQLRVDICGHNLPVRLVGIGAALGYAMEGMTHHALEDVAITRALPNLTVLVPGDRLEVRAVVEHSLDYEKPLYIRLAKDMSETAHQTVPDFAVGRAIPLDYADEEIVLLNNGPLLSTAVALKRRLALHGISLGVISMPSVKPLDLFTLRRVARRAQALFTLEEHSIIGGFGSAVAENLLELGFRGVFKRFGLRDRYFDIVGDVDLLRQNSHLDIHSLESAILALLRDSSAMPPFQEHGEEVAHGK